VLATLIERIRQPSGAVPPRWSWSVRIPTELGDNRAVPTRHGVPRLLPHERWFANAVARRQQNWPTEQYRRYQAKYGPDGTILLLAGQVTGLAGSVVVLLSIALLPVSQYSASWFLAAGFAVGAVCTVRAAQAACAGRKFRGVRPPSS
jgi:hypothetical protein